MTKCVYVVGPDEGPVKVGITGNMRRRLYELERKIGCPLTVAHTATPENPDAVEAMAHWLLRSSHLGEEVFSVTTDAAISAVSAAVEAVGRGERAPQTIAGPGRKMEFPDELFIRMPASTKRRLEELAGASPVPAAWLRQFIIGAIGEEEAKREADQSGGAGVRRDKETGHE